jgi:hypothetical protein
MNRGYRCKERFSAKVFRSPGTERLRKLCGTEHPYAYKSEHGMASATVCDTLLCAGKTLCPVWANSGHRPVG